MAWRAIVLAAGRGPGDPMAAAYGVSHKCLVEIGGVPMLRRVVETLLAHPSISADFGRDRRRRHRQACPWRCSLPRSSLCRRPRAQRVPSGRCFKMRSDQYPILLTTADHPLLTAEMLDTFSPGRTSSHADSPLASRSAETILAAYPDASRTFLALAPIAFRAAISSASAPPKRVRRSTSGTISNHCARNPGAWSAAFGPCRCCAF